MFTGLVEGIGSVGNVLHLRDEIKATISPRFKMTDWQMGESICVDGVCLTVTDLKKSSFTTDVSGETLSRTTLSLLKQRSEVNLERALRLSDRLGGHLVSGHVDGIGKILKRERVQRSWLMRIGVDENISRYIIEKGSIAVDGISLTVNQYGERFFEVNIIPHTGIETTILKKEIGDLVNIETDLIGKYIEKFFQAQKSRERKNTDSNIDLEMLGRHGFNE